QSSAGARQVAGTTGANTVWLSPCKYDCTAEKLMAEPLLFFSTTRTVAVVVPLGSVRLESMASVVMSQSTSCSISAVGSACAGRAALNMLGSATASATSKPIVSV